MSEEEVYRGTNGNGNRSTAVAQKQEAKMERVRSPRASQVKKPYRPPEMRELSRAEVVAVFGLFTK